MNKPLSIRDLLAEDDIVGDGDELYSMSIDEYREQLERLFPLDHHKGVRITLGGPYAATTKEQVEALIEYLQLVKKQMR